jgi:hypothetical protein
MHLDLSDEEEAVLAVELVQLISRAKYPFSDRVRTLGASSPSSGQSRRASPCRRRRFMRPREVPRPKDGGEVRSG